MNRALLVALLSFTLVPALAAQRNELGLLAGGMVPVSTPEFEADSSLALQVNYAHRLAAVPLLSLHFDLPLIVGFEADISQPAAGLPEGYRSIFLTPGLKVKFAPGFPVSPFLVAGGGWARFRTVGSGNGEQVTNTGVFAVGGGLDFKLVPFLGARAEIRDFYSGSPRLTLDDFRERQHTLVVSAGLVLRF